MNERELRKRIAVMEFVRKVLWVAMGLLILYALFGK